LIAAAVGAGYEQAMQNGEKNGSLNIELELPIFQKIADDFSDAQFLPYPLEDHRRTDFLCHGLDIGIIPGRENQDYLLGEPQKGTSQILNFPFRLHLIEAAEGGDDPLDGLVSFPAIFDYLEILVIA
jgi:hypothetical protein